MEKRIETFLKNREKSGLIRRLNEVELGKDARILVAGKEYINFSSNDYLGLSAHPDIINAAGVGSRPVFGSSSSRLMTGSTIRHHLLEEKIANLKQKPAALIFNSGYQANLGVINALCGRHDVIFADRLVHASIVDGIKLSGARLIRFKHNDTGHLEKLLFTERKKYKGSLIVTETVFSMDGDIAPIKDIVMLKKKYDSMLMVDEAHATGIFGKNGAGILEQAGLSSVCDVVMGTFSKALGGFGAYVAVSACIRDYLVNTCRSFIYSTALPVAVINADLAALDVLDKEPNRRKVLLSRAEYLRNCLHENGFITKGESQIVPVIIGDPNATVCLSESLQRKGYWVTPVRPPTVPEATSRLRICVTYDHTEDILKRFSGCLKEAYADTV